jgi:transposase
MFSTKGRARVLTDAQVQQILEWQRTRKTLGQVARENGVSRGTVEAVIRTGGRYKRRSLLPGPAGEPSEAPEARSIRSGRWARR